jgi:Xaa-Pro aminopeptidase
MKILDKIKYSIGKADLDAFLVSGIENIKYLTGFSGSNALCILTPKTQYIITDFRYKEQIVKEVKGFKILISGGSLFEELFRKQILEKSERIGFESEIMTYATFSSLKKLFKGKKLIPFSNFIENAGAVKNPDEIEKIKTAIQISELAFKGLLEGDLKDLTEKEIAFELSSRMIIAGAEKNSFDPIVASGPNSSMPHAKPTDRKIKRNEPLLLDFGAEYNKYNSDITRTVFLGKAGKEFQSVYKVVSDAQKFAIDGIKAGMKCKDIDALAREHIHKKGYGKYFGHALGHGIGINSHNLPLISYRSENILEEYNVITIEPGIYLPGKFGIRIEDDILVKKDGFEILTNIDRELITLE